VQSVTRATAFTAAAEDWKNGTIKQLLQTAYGLQPIIMVVGGISAMQSYGMGRWNPYINSVDNFG